MTKLANKIYFKGLELKYSASKIWKNERGDTNIVAIIIILAIVIALAIIFRESIMNLFKDIWNNTVVKDTNSALGKSSGI